MAQAHSNKWELVLKRSFIHEKKIDEEKYTVPQIVSLHKEVKLFQIVTSSKKFAVQIVREVIANLAEDFGISWSTNYVVVKIRGNELSITPDMINEFYEFVVQDVVAEEQDLVKVARCLTGDQRTKWIDQNMSSTDLPTKIP